MFYLFVKTLNLKSISTPIAQAETVSYLERQLGCIWATAPPPHYVHSSRYKTIPLHIWNILTFLFSLVVGTQIYEIVK